MKNLKRFSLGMILMLGGGYLVNHIMNEYDNNGGFIYILSLMLLISTIVGGIMVIIYGLKALFGKRGTKECENDSFSKRKLYRGTLIKGTLNRKGSGIIKSTGWSKYSLLQINSILIENVYVDGVLDSFLDVGAEYEFHFKKYWILYNRTMLLSLKCNGVKYKMPLSRFLIILLEINIKISLFIFPIIIFTPLYLFSTYGDDGGFLTILFFLTLFLIVSIRPIKNYINS